MILVGSSKKTLLFLELPLLIYTLIFFVYPVYLLIYYSFTDFLLYKPEIKFIGFENYIKILTGRGTFYYMNQIIYTVVVTFGSLALGMGFALLVDYFKRHRIFQRVLSALIMMPMLLIPAAVGVTWVFMYSEYYGPFNFVLRLLGLPTKPWLYTTSSLWYVMLTDIWGWSPFVYIILLAALQQIDPSILEAAEIDGATGFRRFLYITLPSILPLIGIVTTIKLIDTYKEFDCLYTMTQGGPGDYSTNLNVAIYRSFYKHRDFGTACAYGVLTLIFPILIVIIYHIISKRMEMRG